jgi:DNA-binding transcriptional LysR family regulator
MNDFVGLAHALQTGAGIGELPPIVRPELMRDGRLVEVMPKWRFETLNLSMVHLGNRYIPRPLRIFKEFAAQMARKLFLTLPN